MHTQASRGQRGRVGQKWSSAPGRDAFAFRVASSTAAAPPPGAVPDRAGHSSDRGSSKGVSLPYVPGTEPVQAMQPEKKPQKGAYVHEDLAEVYQLLCTEAGGKATEMIPEDFQLLEAEVYAHYRGYSKEQLHMLAVKHALLQQLSIAAAELVNRRLRVTAKHLPKSDTPDRQTPIAKGSFVFGVRSSLRAAKRMMELHRELDIYLDQHKDTNEAAQNCKKLQEAVMALGTKVVAISKDMSDTVDEMEIPGAEALSIKLLKAQNQISASQATAKSKAEELRTNQGLWAETLQRSVEGVQEIVAGLEEGFGRAAQALGEATKRQEASRTQAEAIENQYMDMLEEYEELQNLHEELQTHSVRTSENFSKAEEKVAELERLMAEAQKMGDKPSSCGICGACLKRSIAGREKPSKALPASKGVHSSIDSDIPQVAPSVVPQLPPALLLGGVPQIGDKAGGVLNYLSHIRIGGLYEVAAAKKAGFRVISVLDFEDEPTGGDETMSRWVVNKLVQKSGAVKRALRRDSKSAVFVHCMQGVNRSVAAVVAYLLVNTPLSLSEAYQAVKIIRPQGNIMERNTFHPELTQITKNERKDVDDVGQNPPPDMTRQHQLAKAVA